MAYDTVAGEIRFETDYNGTLSAPANGKNATLTDGTRSATISATNSDCPDPLGTCTGNDATATMGPSARGWFADSYTLYVDAPRGILVAGVPGNITGMTAELNRGIVTVLNPAFTSAAYHASNGTVSMQFSRDIASVNGSRVGIIVGTSTVHFAGNYTTYGGIVHLALSDAVRSLLDGATSLTMRVGEGAVTSTSGHLNAATGAKNVTIHDETKPSFLDAAYHAGNGTVSIRFSESIGMVDGSRLILADGASTVRLSSSAAVSGHTATDTLNQTVRNLFAHASMMSLDIRQGAVADAFGNRIDASSNNTVFVHDTIKPTVSHATYHAGNGTLSVQFSEAIMAANDILMVITAGNDTLQLQGAVVSGDTITATPKFEDGIKIYGAASLSLAIPAGMIRDMHGNYMDAVSGVPLYVALDGAADFAVAELAGAADFAVAELAGAASFGAGDFVTTWNTTAANESITINVGGHGGTYTVHWGDGTNSTQSGNAIHTYASAGSYNVTISGDFVRIKVGDSANARKLVALVQWGNTTWSSMVESFQGASNMVYSATDTPDLSGVTNMYMGKCA